MLRELSSLLKINGLNEELRVLLELPIEEIPAWLLDIGVPAEKLTLVYKWAVQANSDSDVKQDLDADDDAHEPAEVDAIGIISESYEQGFYPDVSASEIELENVQINSRAFQPSFQASANSYAEIKDAEVRLEVGRWSEELVNNFFLTNTTDFSNVEWQNKVAESGKPYDFKVVQNGVEKYIEVKGTPSADKDIIYLSKPEWQLMFQQAGSYQIYRVFNAGKDAKVRIEIIDNPSDKVKIGELLPSPIALQI